MLFQEMALEVRFRRGQGCHGSIENDAERRRSMAHLVLRITNRVEFLSTVVGGAWSTGGCSVISMFVDRLVAADEAAWVHEFSRMP